MEPLVWLNRTISLHTSEPGASFPETDTELWEKDLGREFFHGKTRGSGGVSAGYVPVTPWGTGGHQQELGDLVCARNEPFAAQSQNTEAVEAGASWAEPRC